MQALIAEGYDNGHNHFVWPPPIILPGKDKSKVEESCVLWIGGSRYGRAVAVRGAGGK
ncbi:hypothetical protein QA641_14335 [Bradyrhizobium sp. CB1650]|uniref:hypothetical protein n=1 Tax=Bradyrhizobium sp. CB1650 TaxID=3039153 RepID=UPI0024361146|nr:hypothetical protein [Bradyrhizobium sp. CB1650]WGD54984.1 hypothetical protein QA641_14335 [Bradyrhizobium sp. CB1650]